MSPQLQMRIAVAMMFLGLCPFLLGLAWVIKALSEARHHGASVGASDAFLMMVVMFGSYAFALIVAGGGSLLSYRAVRRTAVPITGTGLLRLVVAVVLALPVFLFAAVSFSSV